MAGVSLVFDEPRSCPGCGEDWCLHTIYTFAVGVTRLVAWRWYTESGTDELHTRASQVEETCTNCGHGSQRK